MNVITTSFSPTHIILAWTLLGILLSWLIIFTVLALREFVLTRSAWEDEPTPSRPLLAISTLPVEEHRQYVGVAGGNVQHEGNHPLPT